MIGRVRAVAYGRPASDALAEAVVLRSGPLAPATVIVPSNFAGLSARRRLGQTGIANVAFVTPFRLAEMLGATQLLDTRPLTNPVLAAAVRLALAEDPGPYAAVADHHATEAAVASLYAELSKVSPASRALLPLEPVRMHDAIGRHLTAFHDESDLAHAAAQRADLAEAVEPLGHVIWYLPAPTPAPLADLVGAVLSVATTSTVILGSTGAADADEAVSTTCARAGVEPPRGAVAAPTADRIVSVTDADEEVRAVVRSIAALAEGGTPLDRIGVFHPVPDPYLGILEQQLAAAGIPANGPARRRLIDSVAGRTLLAALALPSQRWRRDRVLALVSGGPVHGVDGPARPAAWESLSRRAGVVRGLDDWHRKLAARRGALDRRLAELDAADPQRTALEHERSDTEQLGAFVTRLAADVAAVEQAEGWSARCVAATELLHRLLGPDHAHTGWPEAEQQAFERVTDALVRLAALDELEPDPSHTTFVRALRAELDVTRGRSGRFGEGVVYGPLAAAVGLDLDAVFVLGCTEGQCPSARRVDAMLPDAVRRLVPGELELRGARLGDQHRSFLTALAAAPVGGRVLTFARGDLRGNRQAIPSRWLLDSASALAGHTVHATDVAVHAAPEIESVPSYATGLTDATVHGTLEERDAAAADAALLDDLVGRGLAAQRERRSADFTEWDGNLGGQPVPSAADRSLSPSRLESWAACGYRYFLAHVLGLADRDDPERVVDLGPLDRGSGVHEVLERFVAEAIDEGVPAPDEPWTPAQHARLAAIAEEVFAAYEARGRTGRLVHWRLTKADLLALLDDFLHADDRYRAESRSRPVQVELAFGLDGAAPVVVPLPDGRAVAFRGRADRVDRAEDGRLLVSDYKTGRGDRYTDIATDDPVQAGTTLQLGLYAEAAIQHLGADAAEAHYWMVDPRAAHARYGYEWSADRRRRFGDVLATIVDGIEAGVFPAVPGEWNIWRRTHESCTYCEFDPVCARDRGEQATAKVAAPELRRRDGLEPT